MIEANLVQKLVDALGSEPGLGEFASEADFERRFVEPVCRKLLEPALQLYVHPWGDKTKKRDWRESKEWGAVHAWGTVQAFDLLGREERRKAPRSSLAVEVKLAKIRDGRFPTGDFQRMLGQCVLARLVHEVVVGVFGYTGDLSTRPKDKSLDYEKQLARGYGIWLVMNNVGEREA